MSVFEFFTVTDYKGAVVLIISIAILAVIFFARAYALNKIAKTNGLKELSILAYIPIAQSYLIACIGGDAVLSSTLTIKAEILGIILIIANLVSRIWHFGLIMTVILAFLLGVVYRNLLRKVGCEENNVIFYTILSVFVPLFLTLYLYQKARSIDVE